MTNISEQLGFIEHLSLEIKWGKSYIDKIKSLALAYKCAKAYSNEDNYELFWHRIRECEKEMPYRYIIDTKPIFEVSNLYSKNFTRSLDKFSSHEEILNYIVSLTRNYLYHENMYSEKQILFDKVSLDSIDLCGSCHDSASFTEVVCNILKIKSEKILIEPAFDETLDVLDYGYHSINIIYLDDKKYIVDCTYRQFFDINGSLLEKLGVYGLAGCLPGIYMLQNDSRKQTAVNLLEKGWIPMDSVNAKNYFDGFALFYRNGIYYDQKGIVDYQTDYTIEDYENFITKKDNQGNHEPIEGLGRQLDSIRNKKLKFETDISIFN